MYTNFNFNRRVYLKKKQPKNACTVRTSPEQEKKVILFSGIITKTKIIYILEFKYDSACNIEFNKLYKIQLIIG